METITVKMSNLSSIDIILINVNINIKKCNELTGMLSTSYESKCKDTNQLTNAKIYIK